MNADTGILLVNIGSPDAPTPVAVRRYLRKFLSDDRVVEIPKIAWLPILYGIILPLRGRSSAKLYQKIWTKEGSPLTVISKQLSDNLASHLNIPVALGMHYGNPSLKEALASLRASHIKKIIILPLYPQYSASTTASAFDAIASILKTWREIPEIKFIKDYADHPDYINAIATSIQNKWDAAGKPQHLLFSFHGLPKSFAEKGDPYPARCQLTARLVAEKLNLNENDWSLSFQSRLGRTEWLKPYTDQMLMTLAKQEKSLVDVVCPGFAVDCLETLEEIAIRGKDQFLSSGGKELRYIPALNATDEHCALLMRIL